MRVTAVDMYGDNIYPVEPISFSLLSAEPNAQYEVRTILGLDADDIIPKFYGSSIDGQSKFYDFGLKPRDIVMRIVLNPRTNLDESYADVRDGLYRIISGNRTGRVKLHFRAGATTVAGIFGQIVKFEAVHFTQLPEVQLTIRCNNPMFEAINPVIFDPSNPGLVANPISIPDSISTAPHGFQMEVVFTGTAASFTIQDFETDPTWMFKVTPTGGFLVGDHLYFSSSQGYKGLFIDRSSTLIQLVDKIDPASIWPILFPGANFFHFTNLASIDFVGIQYYASYWGV